MPNIQQGMSNEEVKSKTPGSVVPSSQKRIGPLPQRAFTPKGVVHSYPKGVLHRSPGLRTKVSYPGLRFDEYLYPEGVLHLLNACVTLSG